MKNLLLTGLLIFTTNLLAADFYSLKEWISLEHFLNDNATVTEHYLDNAYDRGLTSLSILSFPLAAICYLYKNKVLAYNSLDTCFKNIMDMYDAIGFF